MTATYSPDADRLFAVVTAALQGPMPALAAKMRANKAALAPLFTDPALLERFSAKRSTFSGSIASRDQRPILEADATYPVDAFARPTDIDPALAVRAFEHNSHTPGRRAASHLREYADALNNLPPEAQTPEVKAKFKGLFRAYLHAKANTSSWMVTGRSGRNERREQKKHDTADRRLREAMDYLASVRKRVAKQAKADRIEAAGGPEAILKRKIEQAEAFQEAAKAANRIYRKKGMSDADKVAAIVALGISESTARKGLVPDYMGKTGIPSYALSNNRASIKRMKDQLAEMGRRAAVQESATSGGADFTAPDGTEVNVEITDDRVRLTFDKGAVAFREQVKASGFKWSPRNTAWQRQLTENALAATARLLDLSGGADALTRALGVTTAPPAAPSTPPTTRWGRRVLYFPDAEGIPDRVEGVSPTWADSGVAAFPFIAKERGRWRVYWVTAGKGREEISDHPSLAKAKAAAPGRDAFP